jgi:hypothetical protein
VKKPKTTNVVSAVVFVVLLALMLYMKINPSCVP